MIEIGLSLTATLLAVALAYVLCGFGRARPVASAQALARTIKGPCGRTQSPPAAAGFVVAACCAVTRGSATALARIFATPLQPERRMTGSGITSGAFPLRGAVSGAPVMRRATPEQTYSAPNRKDHALLCFAIGGAFILRPASRGYP